MDYKEQNLERSNAARLGLPVLLYRRTIVFRLNLEENPGFTTELIGAGIKVYGRRYGFCVIVRCDRLAIDAIKLDSPQGVEVRIFFKPGLPDFRTFRSAFYTIVRYDDPRPLPLRRAQVYAERCFVVKRGHKS